MRDEQTLLECAMLKDPPYGGLCLEKRPEFEKGPDRFMRCFDRGADVALYARGFVLAGLQDHQAVVVIACQEQILTHGARCVGDLILEGKVVERRQVRREGFVQAFVVPY